MKSDVVIIGGGVGGLWTLYELSQQEYRCVLIEHGDLGQGASTHGQNRLHTGEIYAAFEGVAGRAMVEACQLGRRTLEEFAERFCQSAIEQDGECLHLFPTLVDAKSALERLDALIPSAGRLLDRDEIEELEPLLQPSPSPYGLMVEETTFNAHELLTAVSREAAKAGGYYLPAVRPVTELGITRTGDLWRVKGEYGVEVEAPVLVLAAGSQNGPLYDRVTGRKSGLKSDRGRVAVIHDRVSERILSPQSVPDVGFLALIPHQGGTTMMMYNEPPDSKRWLERLARALSQQFEWPTAVECDVHFYECERLLNIDHSDNVYPLGEFGKRHYFWLERKPENLFCFSPGKFTTAPLAAKALVERIRQKVLPDERLIPLGRSETPRVAKLAYYEVPTHIMKQRDKRIVFEPVDG